MKKTIIFCDICPAEKQNHAIYSCVVCGRDCCAGHSGSRLPQVLGAQPYRASCNECGSRMDPNKFPPMPQDLTDALTRWQDQIIEQTKAEISAAALRDEKGQGIHPQFAPHGALASFVAAMGGRLADDEGQRILDEEAAREIADEEAAFKEGLDEKEKPEWPRRQMIP